MQYFDHNINRVGEGISMFFSIFIAVAMILAFQITFTALMTPFILISLVYHRFFDKILLFFDVGND